jgi:hypothetical protein
METTKKTRVLASIYNKSFDLLIKHLSEYTMRVRGPYQSCCKNAKICYQKKNKLGVANQSNSIAFQQEKKEREDKAEVLPLLIKVETLIHFDNLFLPIDLSCYPIYIP